MINIPKFCYLLFLSVLLISFVIKILLTMRAQPSKRKRYTVDISVKDVYKKSFYNLIEKLFCQHDRISVTLLRFPNNRRSPDS